MQFSTTIIMVIMASLATMGTAAPSAESKVEARGCTNRSYGSWDACFAGCKEGQCNQAAGTKGVWFRCP
ncbi:hypothetical protein MGN70_007346 [Eutypa lata]|nr:hypothetical protein MGN70_007346 [Eutypa lata]